MSNPNPKPSTPAPAPDKPERNQPPVTSFNLPGWVPTVCTFNVSKADFCAAVLDIARNYIKDFSQCSFEPGRNGYNALLLWLPADSDHLVDKASTTNTILKRAVKHVSPAMKDFQNKFCRARDNDGSPEVRDSNFRYGEIIALDRYNDSSRNMTALVVNPKPFIDAMFDSDGRGYQATFGGRAPFTDIEVEFVRHKNGSKYGELTGLEISKKTRNRLGQRGLHTKFAVLNN